MDNPERVTYFAATDSRGKRVPFGIKQKDRNKHMYVIGKTGMGKSTLLENMAIQDIQNGEGLAFLDPHGGTAEKLLEYIPEHRIKDVVYFAPFDLQNPIAFNVMEDVGYDKRHLVVSGLMAAFKKIWVDAWSARMEYILSNTLLALLEYPEATLLGVNRMYTDKAYRKKVVENIQDPVVKDFWTKEFTIYTDRYTQEATPAIQNKIGQFTSNPLIRNIIGQPHSSFDLRTLMDEKKILIMNLSKGLVGETNMRLLGSMLTTRIFLGAMSRADASRETLERLPNFYFYVDEFQNFANETFAEILSEARKYKLNLIIAHQYIEQMEEEVRAAVFGNVGTTITFRVGPFDAEVLETIFSPEFNTGDLVNLGFTHIYLTLMIDGIGSRPFSAVTLPPIEPPRRHFKAEVVRASQEHYGRIRETIESAILAELAPPSPEPHKKQEKKQGSGQKSESTPKNSASGKSASDVAVDRESLRATLAAMAEKVRLESEKRESAKTESLKNALTSSMSQPRNTDGRGATTPPTKRAPFEVSEETLRAVFKDDA
ncbi:type IV secretion system DNA-binding domain-containing protein [Candidatus Parcubacteria bacterium]|nr:type IV secretion system DNA-binding domain-containing protein [Candidatus Parcubacteria bacterium]